VTANVTRDHLHQLVDALPESQWSSAERALQYLHLQAHAVSDDEEWSQDDEAALLEAEVEIERGGYVSHTDARRQLFDRQ
jgi:hypothetical protein